MRHSYKLSEQVNAITSLLSFSLKYERTLDWDCPPEQYVAIKTFITSPEDTIAAVASEVFDVTFPIAIELNDIRTLFAKCIFGDVKPPTEDSPLASNEFMVSFIEELIEVKEICHAGISFLLNEYNGRIELVDGVVLRPDIRKGRYNVRRYEACRYIIECDYKDKTDEEQKLHNRFIILAT